MYVAVKGGEKMTMDAISSRLRKRYINGKAVPLWQPDAQA